MTALSLFALTLFAIASSDSTGRVMGSIRLGERPASYANAIVLGSRRGVQANERGEFTIERVPAGSDTLRVSLIGARSELRAIQVRAGKTTDVGVISLHDLVALEFAGEGPTVTPIPTALVKRIRESRLESLDRVKPGQADSSRLAARLEGYIQISRATPPDDSWTKRLAKVLSKPDTFRRYLGKEKKLCIFRADIEARFLDAQGPIDLWLCFGCDEILIRGEHSGSAQRDFGLVSDALLDLALEAFPEDPALLARRRETKEPPK